MRRWRRRPNGYNSDTQEEHRRIERTPPYIGRGSRFHWGLLTMITIVAAVFNQVGSGEAHTMSACNCTKPQFLCVANLGKFSNCPLEP